MSEFDDHDTTPSPENALRARVKLQRVVFGALAAVLVALGTMGLTAYREMQGRMQAAREAETAARQVLATENERGDRLDRLLTYEQAQHKQISRALGLAQCRLAVAEAAAGRLERGRELLQEARTAGAPPWWPLAATLLREPTGRFAGGPEADRPVTAGALSGDGRRVVVARTGAEGASVLMLYSCQGGDPLVRVRLPDAPGLSSPVVDALFLDRAGVCAVAAAPGRLFFVEFRAEGERVHELVAPHAPDQHTGGRLRGLVADADCRQLFLVRKGSLTRMDRGAQGQAWSETPVPTDLPETDLHAYAPWAGGSALADADRVLLARGGRFAVAHRFSFAPTQVCLLAGPGVVWAAARDARRIELAAVPLAGGEASVTSLELATPQEEWFGFLADGALLCGGGGRAFEITASGSREVTLGSGALAFAARHERGLLFANSRGEFSLRPANGALAGLPMASAPAGAACDAQPAGFVALAGGQSWVLPEGGGTWFSAEGASQVFAQPGGYVASNGTQIWQQSGVRAPMNGLLLGSARDGTLLLRVPGGGLLARQGNQDLPLASPYEAEPDECVFAARAAVCALRWGDQVFVCDLRSVPRLAAARADAAIDRLALDADGRTLAVLAGTTVRLVPLTDAATGRAVVTRNAPRAIALLFGGTVLAAAEGGELVLYEVQGARELWRGGSDVTDVAANGDETLLLAAGGLKLLRLGE